MQSAVVAGPPYQISGSARVWLVGDQSTDALRTCGVVADCDSTRADAGARLSKQEQVIRIDTNNTVPFVAGCSRPSSVTTTHQTIPTLTWGN